MAMQINGFGAMLNNAMAALTGGLPMQPGNMNDMMAELLGKDAVALSDKGAAAAATAGSVVSTDDDSAADAAKDAAAAAKDAADIDGADAADAKPDPEQIKRDAFDKNFTKEKVADLLGKQPEDLNDAQSKNLNDLLYGINEENAKRAAEGKDPMTRDEVNAFITDAVSKYKDDLENKDDLEENPDTLGKTFSELGLEEGVDEDTFKAIEDALKEYNDSDEAKDAAEAAKKAEEDEKTEEDKKAEDADAADKAAENQAADQAAQQANGDNGGGGGGNGGGTGGVGNAGNAGNAGKTGDTTKAGEAGDNLPDNLDELQALRSETQGKIGELKGQIDDKQSAINDRRQELIKEALGDEKNATSDEYNKAKADFDTARTAKDKSQQDINRLNQEAVQNDTALYANADARAAKGSELQQAESELNSLQPPADDADDAAKSAYTQRKAALENEIQQLKTEKQALDAEFQNLQNEKDRIADEKMQAQQEVDTQQMAMDDAQARMDKAADKLSEENEEVKKALEEDDQLKTLQGELEKAQGDLADAEAELSSIEAKISTKEMEDPEIREMRKEEAEFQVNKAAEELGAPVDDARTQAENSAAQDKYGKPYSELNDDQKKALEAEITGVVTTELMDWAKDRLMEDPYNSEALEIIENGFTTLEAQKQEAGDKMQSALENLPKSLQKGAKAAMEDAVAKAEAAGEDPNIAAMQALKAFSDEQLGGLEGDERKAVQNISDAADAYAKAMARVTEGVDDLNDAEFLQEMAALPEPQRSEVSALRESVAALGEEQKNGDNLETAREKVNAYLENHPNLTMSEAREKFGVYGPAALAAAQDADVAAMIEAEAKGEDVLDNQKTEIFMQGMGSFANAQADKATAEEAKKWEEIGLAADKAVQVATNPEVKAMLEAISPNIVELYVEGDIEGLNEDLLNRLAQVGEILGTKVHITSGYRSREEQARLYQMYLNGTGNLAAPPGSSRHETGNAADCSIGGMNIGNYPGAADAMRQVGLGLPVGGEAWHVEISNSFAGL